jgi:F-type H+-transporting ATPase subunit c
MKKKMLALVSFLLPLVVSATAFAQDEPSDPNKGWAFLAAGLGLGIAAFGGALGQGRAAGAALSGIARNPNASGKIFTPMILGLALIESLVIYSLVISILILNA